MLNYIMVFFLNLSLVSTIMNKNHTVGLIFKLLVYQVSYFQTVSFRLKHKKK